MRLTSPRHLLLSLGLLTLAACHSRDAAAPPGDRSPEAAVRQSIALIRAGDVAGFWRHALPPQDYAQLRADWARARTGQAPMPSDERERIDATLRQLAAPDAEAAIDARLQPWLADIKMRYGDQLPLLVGIGRALADKEIAASPRLGQTQKRAAAALLEALGPWAEQAPWFDPGRARQAVRIVAAAAHRLHLRDAQAWRTMDFDQAMRGYGIALEVTKQVLALYGLPLDQALDSARVVPLEYQPPYARVRIEYQLLGKPLAMESTLVLKDGHWYDQDLLQGVRQSHQRVAAAPGTAGMAPAAATAPR